MRRALFGQFISFGQSGAAAIIGKLLRVAVIGMPLFVVGAATHAQTLASLPSGSKAVERSGTAKPVIAWVKFCEQFPAECAIDTAEPAVIPLTKETWNALVSVNRTVNKRIKPITDKEHWGLVDRWEFPDDGMGDCEDFQLLKRKILVEQYGLPKRAFRMTVVIDEQGEGHAVMMVRTDEGDLVLDNKRSSILPWHETGYIFVKREGQDGREWVSLGEQTSPTTTANR